MRLGSEEAVQAARWGVWCAWGGALTLFGLKLAWRWLDGLTSFGKTTLAPPPRPHRLLGFSSRVVFTSAYAGGSLLNAVLLLFAFLFILPSSSSSLYTQFFNSFSSSTSSSPLSLWSGWSASASAGSWYLALGPLLELHLLRRLYECLCVHRFSPRPVSDANAMFAGGYYFFVCLAPWVEFVADTWTALAVEHDHETTATFSPIASVCGCCLFFFASWHQHVCHRILARLRTTSARSSSSSSASTHVDAHGATRRHAPSHELPQKKARLVSAPGQEGRYGLPTGDWFEYVSSPHYLAEILIYVAFVMITGGRVVCLWLILAFVVANLTRSALQTHRWYQGLFPAALPKHRRALFPCLL
jgi:hypothetical protein